MLNNQGLKQGDDRCRPRLLIGTPRGKLVQVGFGDPYGDSVSVILSPSAGEDPCDDAIEFVKDVEKEEGVIRFGPRKIRNSGTEDRVETS